MMFSTTQKISMIERHFAKSKCQHCGWVFEPGCISLVSERGDYCVVTVACTFCKRVAGRALVGIEMPKTPQYQSYCEHDEDEDMEIPF